LVLFLLRFFDGTLTVRFRLIRKISQGKFSQVHLCVKYIKFLWH
jgi:hypothetical protein